MKLFPKITTLNGERLDDPEKLANWMKNLYQKNMVDIISYNKLIPISELRFRKFPEETFQTFNTFNEIQPGVANFKDKLILENWSSGSIYDNLAKWIKDFHLFQGLTVN